MRDVTRSRGERGLSTVELTMALPLVIFGLLMLIGMGHALISKQHAVVGGQVAVHHQRVREAAPNAAAIGRGVTGGAETFRLNGGGEETISYTASAKPQKGVIAQRYPLNAVSQYQTPRVNNACVPNCRPFDSFGRLLSPEIISGIIFSGGGGVAGDILSAVTEKGNKTRKQLPPGANVTTPVQAAAAGGGGLPPGGGGGGGRTGGGGTGGSGNPTGGGGGVTGGTGGTNAGNTGNGGNGMIAGVPVQRRRVEGTPDPERIRELLPNYEQGGRDDASEGLGGARYEMATGRRVVKSKEQGSDIIDPEIGYVQLKGPLVNKRTGGPIRITDRMVDGLADSVVEEVRFNTVNKRVVVDTAGLTPEQRRRLEQKIEEGLTKTPGNTKEIFILE
jgi:hypothetical protein